MRKSVKVKRQADIGDPAVVEAIRSIRRDCREDAGCGGQCHEVASVLMDRFGWESRYGVYLAPSMEPVGGDHSWNILPDGSILDATADQFQEGHDIRVVPLGDAEQARYRPEWSPDYNPSRAAEYPELAGVAWTGEFDFDRSRRLRDERGKGWWMADPSAHRDWDWEDDYGTCPEPEHVPAP